jgi:hypothetical protein
LLVDNISSLCRLSDNYCFLQKKAREILNHHQNNKFPFTKKLFNNITYDKLIDEKNITVTRIGILKNLKKLMSLPLEQNSNADMFNLEISRMYAHILDETEKIRNLERKLYNVEIAKLMKEKFTPNDSLDDPIMNKINFVVAEKRKKSTHTKLKIVYPEIQKLSKNLKVILYKINLIIESIYDIIKESVINYSHDVPVKHYKYNNNISEEKFNFIVRYKNEITQSYKEYDDLISLLSEKINKFWREVEFQFEERKTNSKYNILNFDS